MDNGKKSLVGIQASEKLYQDFELKVTNKGGHSSLPTPDNAIYELADGLARLQQFQFPFELNDVTRAYFARMADLMGGETGADMKAIIQVPADSAAIDRLAKTPYYNARMHTTCVPTRLAGGHANNALPGSATANINCRILPGHSARRNPRNAGKSGERSRNLHHPGNQQRRRQHRQSASKAPPRRNRRRRKSNRRNVAQRPGRPSNGFRRQRQFHHPQRRLRLLWPGRRLHRHK